MRRAWDFHGETKVYRLYNVEQELLYIGVTVGTHLRFKQHEQWTWWAEVDDWTVAKYPTRREALAAEREAIETERPRYNIQYNERNPDRVQPKLRPHVRPRGECQSCHDTVAYTPARQYTVGGRVFPASMQHHVRAVYEGERLVDYGRCPGVGKPPVGDPVMVNA